MSSEVGALGVRLLAGALRSICSTLASHAGSSASALTLECSVIPTPQTSAAV